MDRFTIPRHLDDPELIGIWTLDEFLVMFIPFFWGVLTQHVVIGLVGAVGTWFGYRKARAGRSMSWILHAGYWHLPGAFFGLRVCPPSHLRVMAG
ncbi:MULTISPECIES: type IV conjugative transfer system protein TraL [Novosphingobium]|uniref:type IV conjugative transfer system protein TraL n=1 Tax=Novosphingobium TaxID=165696 RepID=UPI00086C3E1D|nr:MULTISPECIES: type IV conjugative transfer system protein TraL [Novosphingobium]ODU77582.1 MAG: type IV conjugative transfer system protein TraL [Novosphingobium sp. SCN 63-17]